MDIAQKFKRALATLSAGAIFASTAGVALAADHKFNDVPADAWYAGFVNQLVTLGAVDADATYEPAENITRAAFAKEACILTDCLVDFVAPATPTFTDVPSTAWYFTYVEALVKTGVVTGYKDGQGNSTGLFGPGDFIDRAAMAKLTHYAFGIPETLTPGSPFSDVKPGQWFHNSVLSLYNWSVIDGKTKTIYDPGAFATRAETAKFLINALNPVERVPVVEPCNPVSDPECTPTPVPGGDGDLEVSLNADTPVSSTVPMSASGVPFTAADFSADKDDVIIQQVTFHRGGVGQRSDMEACYLYSGANRVTTEKTINDENTLIFPLKNWTVKSGTTGTLTVVCDLADSDVAGPSNQHYFYLASAEDIKSNAKSVTGDFPINGNTFTIGGANSIVNTATITKGASPSEVSIGELDAEVATFNIDAGSKNDLGLYYVALNNFGSLSSDKLVNCSLLRGTDEVATAEGFDGDIITFVLDTPFIIPEGQNKTFYVHCDIDGGRADDTVIMALDQKSDLGIKDMQYGFGAKVVNSFESDDANTVVLKGGVVNVADNGPAATQIAADMDSVPLLNYSMTAAQDVSVRDTFVLVTVADSANNKPVYNGETDTVNAVAAPGGCAADEQDLTVVSSANFTAGDMFQIGNNYGRVSSVPDATSICAAATNTLTTGTITERNIFAYLENLKVVDLDNDSTVAGPLSFVSGGSLCIDATNPLTICPANTGDQYAYKFSEDYDLIGGDAKHLSIQLDLAEEIPSGYRINAAVQYPGSTIKQDNNQYVDVEDVIGAGATALAGDFMIVAASNLIVQAASTPTSTDVVKGDPAAAALGISVSAGDAEDVKLKRLDVLLYADADGTFDNAGIGGLAANKVVASVTLYDGNDIVSGPKGISLVNGQTYYQAKFDDLNLNIPAGQTKTLTAKVALLNTAAATQYLALDVDPSTIVAEDIDGNTISSSSGHLNLGDTSPDPVLTILTAGTLTASSEGNPDAAIVVAGSTMQLASKYRMTANKEAFMAKSLTIVNDLSGDFGDAPTSTPVVKNVVIKYPNKDGVMQTKSLSLNADGTAKFSNLDFYIPAGKDVYLEVYADVNTIVNQSFSGKAYRLGLKNVDNTISDTQFIGQSSSFNETFDNGTEVTNPTAPNSFVVRKSVPKVANVASGTTLAENEVTLIKFNVTADAAGSISFGRILFNLDLTDEDAGGELDFSDFKLTRNGSNISDVNIYGNAAGNIGVGGGAIGGDDTVIVSFDKEESVSAGSSVLYELKASAVGTETKDSVNTKLAIGDENVPVTGLTVNNGNANTGRIYSANANEGLITSAANDFADNALTARNFLWSDKSFDVHVYPTVAAGTVTTATGSPDWTNGYLLNLNDLTANTLTK